MTLLVPFNTSRPRSPGHKQILPCTFHLTTETLHLLPHSACSTQKEMEHNPQTRRQESLIGTISASFVFAPRCATEFEPLANCCSTGRAKFAPVSQARTEAIQAELASTKAELQKLKAQNEVLQQLSSNHPEPPPMATHIKVLPNSHSLCVCRHLVTSS